MEHKDRPPVKRFLLVAGAVAVAPVILVIAVLAARTFFNLTSSNALLYLVREPGSGLRVTNDLVGDQQKNVIAMIDANWLFNLCARTEAAIGRENIEFTWNKADGHGVIKEFRSDGSEFLVVLSRFMEEDDRAQGLFIGGDLPLGDTDRVSESNNNNTGIAFYDGKRWVHIWCSLNEGVSIGSKAFGPADWKYLGSRVLKATEREVLVESEHEIRDAAGGNLAVLTMKRTMHKKAGEDYILLQVAFENRGPVPFSYSFRFGDEPWVGDFFRGSKGNVGWTDGALYKYEGYVDPSKHRFAGYWDIGNDIADETRRYSGYADFVEWISNAPDFVYFANDFGYDKVNPRKPLNSWNNRVISLVWLNRLLKPAELTTHLMALGMAKSGYPAALTLPEKPEVRRTLQ